MGDSVLAVRGLTKSYGHVEALRGVDLDVGQAEVVGLIGDNGAGKSTLVRLLSGVEPPDSGTICLDGEDIRLTDPLKAQAHGIATVYQDLALAQDLDPASNLFLGREPVRKGPLGRLGWLDKRRMRREAAEIFAQLGVSLPSLRAPVANLSGGQRQSIAVARAAQWSRRVLVLDEPTAALGVAQTEQVLKLIRQVRDNGVSVILVSHNMTDVLSVCDRITVLRLGKRVADLATEEATVDHLVALITGMKVPEHA
jgi:simple sugar transport system ATP-binding protein